MDEFLKGKEQTRRITVYVIRGRNPRYTAFLDLVPATQGGSAASIMRKLMYEGWPEAYEVGEAWWRGDKEWVEAWQRFDDARTEWYANSKGKKPVFLAATEEKGSHVFIKPDPKEGDRGTVPSPIPDLAKGSTRVAYKLWLYTQEPRHAEIIRVYDEMTDAHKRAGRFQVPGRLALILAAENPDVQRMLLGV